MNGSGFSQGGGQYAVRGASEGPDVGSLSPDAQSFVLRALAQHLDRINDVLLSNAAAPVEQVEYEVDNSNLGAGGQQYHLPTGQSIVSYHIENLSTARLSIFAGPGNGRSINGVAAAYYKVALMPSGITTLTVMTSNTAATGLVRILLTSDVLSPVQGTAS